MFLSYNPHIYHRQQQQLAQQLAASRAASASSSAPQNTPGSSSSGRTLSNGSSTFTASSTPRTDTSTSDASSVFSQSSAGSAEPLRYDGRKSASSAAIATTSKKYTHQPTHSQAGASSTSNPDSRRMSLPAGQQAAPGPDRVRARGRATGGQSHGVSGKLSHAFGSVRSSSRPGTPTATPSSVFGGGEGSKKDWHHGRTRKMRAGSRPPTSSTIVGEDDPDIFEHHQYSGAFNSKWTDSDSLSNRSGAGSQSQITRVSSNASTKVGDYRDREPFPSWAAIRPPDQEGLEQQPLPVRLGLVPAFNTSSEAKTRVVPPSSYRGPTGIAGARYIDGYYLHTPPPRRRTRSTPSDQVPPSASSDSGFDQRLGRHVNSDPSHSSAYSLQQSEEANAVAAAAARVKRPTLSALQPGHRAREGSSSGRTINNDFDPGWDDRRTDLGASYSSQQEWELDDYWVYKESTNACGGKRRARYHAYSRDVVPYFLPHDQTAMLSELYLHDMCYEVISKRLSVIPWGDKKPARVLDVGTGCGAWCIDAAQQWKDTEFVGLDAVPCQTALSNLKNPDLEHRVSWVVANFLEELPFPDASFDFVHVRFLGAHSIQEDQWPAFLSEVTRVLTPEGQVELLEGNWNFRGNVKNISVPELIRIASGKTGWAAPTHEQAIPQPAKDYSAIEDAFDRILARRFINPKVMSVLPSALMTQELRNVRFGNPRRLPVTCKPADASKLSELKGVGLAENSDWSARFTSRSQIGNPLADTGFKLDNYPVFRSIMIMHSAEQYYSARDLVWEESEEERATLLSRSCGPQGGGRLQNAASPACWAHPWRHRSHFNQEMECMRQTMFARADIASFLKSELGWREGNLESVEDRKTAERQRKMSVGVSVANAEVGLPGVGGQDENPAVVGGSSSSPSAQRRVPQIPPALQEENHGDADQSQGKEKDPGAAIGLDAEMDERDSQYVQAVEASPALSMGSVNSPHSSPAPTTGRDGAGSKKPLSLSLSSIPPSSSGGSLHRSGGLDSPLPSPRSRDPSSSITSPPAFSALPPAAMGDHITATSAANGGASSSPASAMQPNRAKHASTDPYAEVPYIGILGFTEATGFVARGRKPDDEREAEGERANVSHTRSQSRSHSHSQSHSHSHSHSHSRSPVSIAKLRHASTGSTKGASGTVGLGLGLGLEALHAGSAPEELEKVEVSEQGEAQKKDDASTEAGPSDEGRADVETGAAGEAVPDGSAVTDGAVAEPAAVSLPAPVPEEK